jgi:hypothetical protein
MWWCVCGGTGGLCWRQRTDECRVAD